MRVREVFVRAERIGTSHRKPKNYGRGRTCVKCGCDLNSYNPNDTCDLDTSPVFRKYRARHRGA